MVQFMKRQVVKKCIRHKSGFATNYFSSYFYNLATFSIFLPFTKSKNNCFNNDAIRKSSSFDYSDKFSTSRNSGLCKATQMTVKCKICFNSCL